MNASIPANDQGIAYQDALMLLQQAQQSSDHHRLLALQALQATLLQSNTATTTDELQDTNQRPSGPTGSTASSAVMAMDSDALLQQCFLTVLEFQRDRNVDVRAFIPNFIQLVCQKNIKVFIADATDALVLMSADESPLVVRNVVYAVTILFRNVLKLVLDSPSFSSDIWYSWQQLISMAINSTNSNNMPLRTIAIKFAETVVLSFSHPPAGQEKEELFTLNNVSDSDTILSKEVLKYECQRALHALLVIGGSRASRMACEPPILLSIMSSLGQILIRRPQFFGDVHRHLGDVACDIESNISPKANPSQKRTLLLKIKVILLCVLKNPYSSTPAIRQALLPAIQALNATQVAGNIIKLVDRSIQKSSLAQKHIVEREDDSKAKKPKLLQREDGVFKAALNYFEARSLVDRVFNVIPVPTMVDIILGALRVIPDGVTSLSDLLASSGNAITTAKENISMDSARDTTAVASAGQTRDPRRAAARDPRAKKQNKLATEQNMETKQTQGSVGATVPPPISKPIPKVVACALTEEQKSFIYSHTVKRIILGEEDARVSGAAHLRIQLLARLLTKFSPPVKPNVEKDAGDEDIDYHSMGLAEVTKTIHDTALDFIETNFEKQMELALQWLYAEAVLMLRNNNNNKSSSSEASQDCGESEKVKQEITLLDPINLEKKENDVEDQGKEKQEPVVDDPKSESTQIDIKVLPKEEGKDEPVVMEIKNAYLGERNKITFDATKAADRYDILLSSIIRRAFGLMDRGGEQGLLSKICINVPFITSTAFDLIRAACEDPATTVIGLSVLRDIIIERGPDERNVGLEILLRYATSKDELLRGPAIRLLANKLFPMPIISDSIERHSRNALLKAIEVSEANVKSEADGDQGFDFESCIYLVIALTAKKSALLKDLVYAFRKSTPSQREKVIPLVAGLAKHIGPSSETLLDIIRNENFSEDQDQTNDNLVLLLLKEVSVMGESPPEEKLIAAVRDQYAKSKQIRFLIPVLIGLQKVELLKLLPTLVSIAPKIGGFKTIINKLMNSKTVQLGPSELMVELHLIDVQNGPATLENIIDATKACFETRNIFKQEVIAVVLQKLVEHSPIPPLFMRTTIQSLKYYPKLQGFVMNILSRLIEKEVWQSKILWDGFLRCCQMTLPKSAVVLLKLPPTHLKNALESNSNLRESMKRYIANSKTGVPGWVLSLVETQQMTSVQHPSSRT